MRLSGPAAVQVAGLIFKPLKNKDFSAFPRLALVGHAHRPGEPGSPLDQVLLTYFPAPASYTGEDVVEISMHGGGAIQAAVLAAALEAGAEPAGPGEFTRRAFLNGRMDLAQAEAVAGLIAAEGERARRLLLRQAEGAMGKAVAGMRADLLAAQALVTAAIDFPEDVEETSLAEAWERVAKVGREAGELAAGAREGVALAEGFTVVLTGPHNVGKSSLLNALLGEERAIVHPHPGTTRDPVEGTLLLDGIRVRLVDTAGVREEGEAEVVEREGIRRARRWAERGDLLVLVHDATAPQPWEREAEPTVPSLRVLNKIDLAPERRVEDGEVRTSCLTGKGIEELRQTLRSALVGEAGRAGEGAVPVTVRQKAALEGVAAACARAESGAGEGMPAECIAVDLAQALHHLAELVGEIAPDEVLDAVFSRFCVGK